MGFADDGHYAMGLGTGEDYSIGRQEFDVDGDHHEIEIEVPLRQIQAHLVGAGKAGALVHLFAGAHLLDSAKANTDGDVTFRATVAGTYTIRAGSTDFGVSDAHDTTLAAPPGGITTVTVPRQNGTLTVTVKDAGDQPVAGATVKASTVAGVGIRAQTDSAGVAQLTHLPNGAIPVVRGKAGLRDRDRDGDGHRRQRRGGGRDSPPYSAIEGVVTDGTDPLAGAQVWATLRPDGAAVCWRPPARTAATGSSGCRAATTTSRSRPPGTGSISPTHSPSRPVPTRPTT